MSLILQNVIAFLPYILRVPYAYVNPEVAPSRLVGHTLKAYNVNIDKIQK